VEPEVKVAIAMGTATKPNFNNQGALNKVTKEKVKEANRMAVWKTSSLMV
jgi:hypothetical protein